MVSPPGLNVDDMESNRFCQGDALLLVSASSPSMSDVVRPQDVRSAAERARSP